MQSLEILLENGYDVAAVNRAYDELASTAEKTPTGDAEQRKRYLEDAAKKREALIAAMLEAGEHELGCGDCFDDAASGIRLGRQRQGRCRVQHHEEKCQPRSRAHGPWWQERLTRL